MQVYNLYTEHCTHQAEGGRKVHLSIDGIHPFCGTPSAWKDGNYDQADVWELTTKKLEGMGFVECERCRKIARKKLAEQGVARGLPARDADRNH